MGALQKMAIPEQETSGLVQHFLPCHSTQWRGFCFLPAWNVPRSRVVAKVTENQNLMIVLSTTKSIESAL